MDDHFDKASNNDKDILDLNAFYDSINLNKDDFSLDVELPAKEQIKEKGRFNADESQYTEVFLREAKEKNLIKDFDFGGQYSKLDQTLMIELANKALELTVDNETGRVFYMLGEKKTFIEEGDDEVIQRKNICELLPDVTFDVNQGGIV